nr:hypothetical transcript [Hymenolepis microstoma]
MLPDCGLQKPPPKCRVNVTLPWNSEQSLEAFVFHLLHVAVSLLGGKIQRVQRWRYSLNSTHRKGELNHLHFESRIHRTLLMVLVLFTILSIPYFPNGVLRVLQAMGIGGCQGPCSTQQ